SVAELDHAVHAELPIGDELPAAAPRPGRATEAGIGQPDRTTGDDDSDVDDDGGEREPPQHGRRLRPVGAPARRRDRLRARSHLNPRAAAVTASAAQTNSVTVSRTGSPWPFISTACNPSERAAEGRNCRMCCAVVPYFDSGTAIPPANRS